MTYSSITKEQAKDYLKSGYTHIMTYSTFSTVFGCTVQSLFPVHKDNLYRVHASLATGYNTNMKAIDLKDI